MSIPKNVLGQDVPNTSTFEMPTTFEHTKILPTTFDKTPSSNVALIGGNSTKPGPSYYALIKAALSLFITRDPD